MKIVTRMLAAVGIALSLGACGSDSGSTSGPSPAPTTPAPPPPPPLTPPEGLTVVEQTETALTLEWEPVATATAYEVHVWTVRGIEAAIAERTSETTLTVDDLHRGTRYLAGVVSLRNAEESEWGPEVETHTLIPEYTCGSEYDLARDFAIVPHEWDGSPIRVDIIDNMPPHGIPLSNLEAQLGFIERMAEDIEWQLGYPVIERGEVISEPEGFAVRSECDNCSVVVEGWEREPRTAVAIYADQDPKREDGSIIAMWAQVWDGLTFWFPLALAEADHNLSWGVLNHEVFHLLGYRHPDNPDPNGIAMNYESMYSTQERQVRYYHYADWQDIAELGCAFPENATPTPEPTLRRLRARMKPYSRPEAWHRPKHLPSP